MAINRRLFGSPIPKDVHDKLEQRQKVAGKANAGESLDLLNKNFSKVSDTESIADLSSRTPFVRMWTCVNIYESESSEVKIEYVDPEKDLQFSSESENYESYESIQKATEFIDLEWKDFNRTDSVYYDPISEKYIVKGELIAKNKQDTARRIYSIGNNILNQFEKNPNEMLGFKIEEDIENTQNTEKQFLPGEFTTNKNEFFRPPTGITSLSTNTLDFGTDYGLTRETVVNFMVHNFHDFEKIYQPYFLSPGALIFIDYGWDTSDLYDPNNIIDETMVNGNKSWWGDLDQLLYGQKGDKKIIYSKDDTNEISAKNVGQLEYDGYMTKANGDLDIVFGQVTNFDSKITEQGSVECTVTILSKNAALYGHKFNTNENIESTMRTILDEVLVLEGLTKILPTDELDKLKELYQQFRVDGNDEPLNNQLVMLSNKLFVNSLLIPDSFNSQQGIFRKGDDFYINLGLFEDKVLNYLFGSGESLEDIISRKSISSGMDSSESFTYYIDVLHKKQQFLHQNPSLGDTINHFLFPFNYNRSYNSTIEKSSGDYPEDLSNYDSSKTKYDRSKDIPRVPIRELFIRTKTIIESFSTTNSKGTFYGAMTHLLNTINENSNNVFDLTFKPVEQDGKMASIIDRNFLKIQENDNQNVFENLFTFDVMSANSIVKGYDVTFNLGDGDIANYNAVKGMEKYDQLFTEDSRIEGVMALKALDEKVDMNKRFEYCGKKNI